MRCLKQEKEVKVQKTLEEILEGLSKQMQAMERAEKNWEKVRKKKKRILGMAA